MRRIMSEMGRGIAAPAGLDEAGEDLFYLRAAMQRIAADPAGF